MTRKAPVVLIPAICRKWKTLQGYRQSRALCNGLPVRAIFNDLESLWRSFVCCKVFRIQFYEYFFWTFRTVLTDMARRAVPRRQLSFLSYLLLYVTLLSSCRRGTCEWYTEHVHAVFGPPAILCSVRQSPLLYQAQKHRQSVNSIRLAVPRIRSAAAFSIEDVCEIWTKLPSITTIVSYFHSRFKSTLFSSFFYRKDACLPQSWLHGFLAAIGGS